MARLRYTLPARLSLEERSFCVLECLNSAGTQIYFDESMPGPVLKVAGQLQSLDSWDEFDWLQERGYLLVCDDDQTSGPTWAGIKALRAWQRKYGR